MYLVAIGKAKHIYTCRERGERHAIVASLGALHARTSRIDDIDMSVLTKSATDNRHQLIGSIYGHAFTSVTPFSALTISDSHSRTSTIRLPPSKDIESITKIIENIIRQESI